MVLDRRSFLSRSGLALAGAVVRVHGPGIAAGAAGATAACSGEASAFDPADWRQVRAQFEIERDLVELAALYVSSHPRAVRQAIDAHRRGLNAQPTQYLEEHMNEGEGQVLREAAEYVGAEAGEIALTDSTTMGLGLLYNGIPLRPGDEILTTEHDYYVTHESVRLAAERTGATVRKTRLFDDISAVSEEEIVGRIAREIRTRTRVLALTWVHSSTGLRIPVAAIADEVSRVNERRGAEPGGDDRLLLCIDGVHGFGVEDVGAAEMGCDFFSAGCHKWLFGPRGTGILWGRGDEMATLRPTIPSFMDPRAWSAWYRGQAPQGPTTGRRMSPGGFKPFEHQWAMAEAFRFHGSIGKEQVAERTHELARRLKAGLAELPNVTLVTPMADELSSGIVCFDVAGQSADDTVWSLRDRRVVATVTPYAEEHARLAPSIRNSPDEIDAAVEAIADLG